MLHSLTHTHLAGPQTEQQGVECAKSTGFDPQCALLQTGLSLSTPFQFLPLLLRILISVKGGGFRPRVSSRV